VFLAFLPRKRIAALLKSPVTQRLIALGVRRACFAAGPTASLVLRGATGQESDAAAIAEVAGWVITGAEVLWEGTKQRRKGKRDKLVAKFRDGSEMKQKGAVP
jgi:hypothetical protein